MIGKLMSKDAMVNRMCSNQMLLLARIMLWEHESCCENMNHTEFACSLVRHERTRNFSIKSQLQFKHLSIVKNFKRDFFYEDNFLDYVTQKELFRN